MVSRLPVFSGKRVGKRVPPEMVLPVFVLVVLFFALLIAYPWWVLTIGTFCYLACLPLGWLSYREYQRRDACCGAGRLASTRRSDMRGCRCVRPMRRIARPAQLRRRRGAHPGSSHATRHPRSFGAERHNAEIIDTLILPFAQRQAQKGFVFGVKGTCVELDLAEPVAASHR